MAQETDPAILAYIAQYEQAYYNYLNYEGE